MGLMETPYENERALDWHDQAVCRSVDPDAFFPDPKHQALEIKAICAECPVRGKCLQSAFDSNEQYGIWGGLTVGERKPFIRNGFEISNEGIDGWMKWRHNQRESLRLRQSKISRRAYED